MLKLNLSHFLRKFAEFFYKYVNISNHLILIYN